jgi:hypothetical protein
VSGVNEIRTWLKLHGLRNQIMPVSGVSFDATELKFCHRHLGGVRSSKIE